MKTYIIVSDLPSGRFWLTGYDHLYRGRWSPNPVKAFRFTAYEAQRVARRVGGEVEKE